MTRTTWIRAHPRKLPDRPQAFYAVHAELDEAWRRDRFYAELAEKLEEEIERDLREDR